MNFTWDELKRLLYNLFDKKIASGKENSIVNERGTVNWNSTGCDLWRLVEFNAMLIERKEIFLLQTSEIP